ncbi:MAG: HigA family addiction module antidote protein [Bacteroidales bacterium]|nr:HigA family addiction module antidote protein [Bacteroidales bacterium]MBP5502047.1 HigA family addiction module antidote protein [Bacteroidales bacterium]
MEKLGYGFYPTHPGEILKDEIEYRKISRHELSEKTGISYRMLSMILNARRPITAEIALILEAALDIPADSLVQLQTKYNMQSARKNPSLSERIKAIKKIAAVF